MTKYSKHKFGKEAREALLKGAETVYKAVSTTLGPRGRNVVLWKNHDTQIQHDGVTVAQHINPKNPYENAGASILKEAAQRQVTNVGDGTTVAVIIGYQIAREALKIVESGVNPMALRAGLNHGKEILLDQIDSLSRPIKTKKQKQQVATIAAEDEELGKMIGDILHKTGVDGVVSVEDVAGPDNFIEHQEGLQIDMGYVSNYFITNPRTMTATIQNARILVTDYRLTDVYEMIPLFKNVVEEHNHKNLMIFAKDIEGTVLATLVQNKLKGQMNTLAVKIPQFHRKENLEDIATVVGARFISSEAKEPLKEVRFEDLGTAEEIKSSNEATVVIGGGGDKKAIEDRIEAIRHLLEEETNEFTKEKLRERLAKLTGGVYVVNVGGHTEVEAREKKERAIDAVMATKAAMKNGVVPGGETVYLRIGEALKSQSEEEEYAYRILKNAIQYPFFKLMDNAGMNSGMMLAGLTSKTEYGVDVETGKITNLIDAGIIDPALVAKEAISNGVSVAIAMITSDAIVVEKDEVPKVPNQ